MEAELVSCIPMPSYCMTSRILERNTHTRTACITYSTNSGSGGVTSGKAFCSQERHLFLNVFWTGLQGSQASLLHFPTTLQIPEMLLPRQKSVSFLEEEEDDASEPNSPTDQLLREYQMWYNTNKDNQESESGDWCDENGTPERS